jgi:hypothetical protein
MSQYFFYIHDGLEFTSDAEGSACVSLNDVSYQAMDVLPAIAREFLPDGPHRTFSVRVRDGDGQFVYRASLTLASAWIVQTIGGEPQPGQDRWAAALGRVKTQVRAIRREFAEDGFSQSLEDLDSLFSVAESEINRLIVSR